MIQQGQFAPAQLSSSLDRKVDWSGRARGMWPARLLRSRSGPRFPLACPVPARGSRETQGGNAQPESESRFGFGSCHARTFRLITSPVRSDRRAPSERGTSSANEEAIIEDCAAYLL